jgi:LacI family transcriptional regulator
LDIREVAKKTGVSIATVSRAINLLPSVNPSLARRIRRVAIECGYFPNSYARSLVSGKSKLFGLVVPDITNPFFAAIVDSFEIYAVQQGYEILLAITSGDIERTQAALRRMIERRAAGVAVLSFGSEQEAFADFGSRDVPIVFLDLQKRLDNAANIRIDHVKGLRQAVQHLAALRHTRIAFIAGPVDDRSATVRRAAFEACMREVALPVRNECLAVGDYTTAGGREKFGELMKSSRVPSAIICSNDLTAIGVLQEATRRGVSVPRDISVVGMENIWFSAMTLPALTTVELPQKAIAHCAFSALTCDSVPTGSAHERSYEVPTELVIRESTAISSRSARQI